MYTENMDAEKLADFDKMLEGDLEVTPLRTPQAQSKNVSALMATFRMPKAGQ